MNIQFSFSDIANALTTPRPARDWALALALAFVVCAATAAYAAYLFIGLRTGSILGSVETASVKASTLKKEDIAATVAAYRLRAELFKKGVAVPGVFDPSK